MKALITGGAGFIGSSLADRLIERGDDVVIVDNLVTGRKDNIPEKAEFHNISIGDTPISPESDILLALDWKSIDVVAHAAASYKDPDDWHTDSLTNVVGTADLIKAMQVRGVERIIYFQTALMYGLKPPNYPIPIDYPQNPVGSSYAVTKTAAENLISTSGLDWVSFRLANCYGPRNLSGPVPTFYKRLQAGQSCYVVNTRRDFVFVDDLLDVVIKAIDGKGRGAYHVSSGSDVRIADLYYAIVEKMRTGGTADLRPRSPDDAETILLDPTQTNIEFDWETKTKLSDGIGKAIEWYKNNDIANTYTHLRLDGAQRKIGVQTE